MPMRPHDDCRALNGARSGSSGSGGSEESGGSAGEEEEWVEVAEGSPARALAQLNALRKSRQLHDALLLAGGAEVAAHRAILAAHSPYLLRALAQPLAPDAPPAYRVLGVTADALRELVEYAYTGRLRLGDGGRAARDLYVAAWRLRMEAARAALAAALLRRPTPQSCLELRALPDLPPHHLHQLDQYIADNFDEICASGALAALPVIRIEMLRVTSAHGGCEAPAAVADAALTWLRDQAADHDLEELCARTHLVYVDAEGALRDCGQLPAARGDAPELTEYRREAAARERRTAAGTPGTQARPLPGLELGERAARPDCAVLAARGADAAGAGRVTRALLVVRGAVAAARVCWRDVAAGEAGAGGALGGAPGDQALPPLAEARAALGLVPLEGRLLACGGYDRARALRTAEAYCPRDNRWVALPELRGARARFPAARLGSSVYVIGGSDGHKELDSVDVYREGAGWGAGPRLPLAVSQAGAAALPDAIFLVGGWAGGRPLRSVLRLKPDTNQWEQMPPLNTGRSACAAAWWEGAVWALGGCDAWHCLASTERLAVAEGASEWEEGPALPTARRSAGGAAWGSCLVVAGGSDGAASLRVTSLLERGAGAWTPGPPLRRARAALALAELDGILYAVGGFDGKEFLSCVEVLAERAGAWTLARPPAHPPAPLTAVEGALGQLSHDSLATDTKQAESKPVDSKQAESEPVESKQAEGKADEDGEASSHQVTGIQGPMAGLELEESRGLAGTGPPAQ